MSQITTCPHCSKRMRVSEQITDKTLICPHCLADVDNPRPGFQFRAVDLDTDVKRGLSVGSVVLAVLIGLCVIGIAIAFFSLYPGSKGNLGTSIGLILLLSSLFGILDVLVSIAIIRGFVRWGASGVRTPSVGKTLGIALLALGSIMAAVIFLFFTCAALLKDL